MPTKDMHSPRSTAVLRRAFYFASQIGHDIAGSEHILWSLCDEKGGAAAKALENAGLDQALIQDMIHKYDSDAPRKTFGLAINLTNEANRVLELAETQRKKLRHPAVEPEHILLALLHEKKCAAAQLINATGADSDRIAGDIMAMHGPVWPPEEATAGKKTGSKSSTKTVERFSRDLTGAALVGKLDPVIGREEEIKRVIQILSRRTKNNPLLIGEPGVGKTAIAEGLALRIVAGEVPKNLGAKRILALDLGKMVSGTKYRGDFEERIKTCLEEIEQAGNILLFIDEMHTLIGTGAAEGALDAASIFKPTLARGEIQVIGATTMTEYKKYIEKDMALERRFQPITVREPSHEDTLAILQGLRPKYEEFHQLTITTAALEAAVALSDRYIQDRHLPDKAIDLVDEAAARVHTYMLTVPPHLKAFAEKIQHLAEEKQKAVNEEKYEEAAGLRDLQQDLRGALEHQQAAWLESQNKVVDKEDIAAVVAAWTGIPVTMLTQEESRRLLALEDTLHQRLIGQNEAVKAIAKAIRRSRVGIKEPQRPIGSFLFLGPTGVGKTELCRALAEAMFQDERAIVRVDMSEFREQHTVSKLIGSPPGYVGYDEGGQLTEKVRRRPYSLVLFDEIEKAHPDVWNTLLQIMDDGRLTDGQGRTVNFKNTIVVMTSNLGAREITGKTPLGFNRGNADREIQPVEELRDTVMGEVKKTLPPEFLNRLDEIIVFHQLDKQHIQAIARQMLGRLQGRAEKLGIALEVEDSALDLLIAQGFDPIYGARPLRRLVQSSVEDAVAEWLLAHDGNEDVSLIVGVKENNIVVTEKYPPGQKAEATDDNVDPVRLSAPLSCDSPHRSP